VSRVFKVEGGRWKVEGGRLKEWEGFRVFGFRF